MLQVPVLLRSTYTLKHCGQVSLYVLIRVGNTVHKITHRQSVLACTLHEVVHTSSQFTHLLLPEEIENVLTVLTET